MKVKEVCDFDLNSYRGRNLVLFFYIKDFAKLCTVEAIAFRDKIEYFHSFETEVIGVSKDPVDTHVKFSEEFSLPFTLVSDPKDALRQRFGLKDFMKCRATVLVDSVGKERFRYCSLFDPVSHVRETLRVLSEL
ncbi:peroxiredoxin [Sulfodiicoccus acidiphilus]|nr:peroxiredoxin [Sulfodiicoccus acidiphilus]